VNTAVRKALAALNQRPFQKLPGCRATLFAELDKPALRPLPQQRFELGQWREAKANIDYHVQVDWHCYSMPYRLVHQPVEVRLSQRTVEIFHCGKRVALHARSLQRGGFTTDPAHRPKSHQRHLDWAPSRLMSWAGKEVGPQCEQVVARLLESKPHPEQGYRASLGIMRLRRQYGNERLEAACRRAVALDACNYQSIKSMLATGADRLPLPETGRPTESRAILHANLRGHDYYRQADPVLDGEQEGAN
jgi:transposase